MAGKKGDDEDWGWRQFRWLPLLVVCGIIVGALLGSGRYLDWIKDWKESRIVRSLGLPDSLQGIAGLELPNIDFTLRDSEKRFQEIGSGYSIKSGTNWEYKHEDPKYEITIISLDFIPDLSTEKFNELDENWVSDLQVFDGFQGGLTFSGLTSSVYFHASDLLATEGKVHNMVFHEKGGKGRVRIYTFYRGSTMWLIGFKGDEDAVEDVSERFMARVKIL